MPEARRRSHLLFVPGVAVWVGRPTGPCWWQENRLVVGTASHLGEPVQCWPKGWSEWEEDGVGQY